MHIAVYGTLKQGFGNHRLLDPRGFRFVGTFKTVDRFHMTSAGGFPIVYKDHKFHNIVAEVYEVTDEAYLSRVDSLEGHPNWYRREPVKLEDDNEIIVAEMYMMEGSKHRPSYHNVRVTNGAAEWVRMHD